MQYQNIHAEILYSADTKSYYGELIDIDQLIIFQARHKHDVIVLMQDLVDQYCLEHQLKTVV